MPIFFLGSEYVECFIITSDVLYSNVLQTKFIMEATVP